MTDTGGVISLSRRRYLDAAVVPVLHGLVYASVRFADLLDRPAHLIADSLALSRHQHRAGIATADRKPCTERPIEPAGELLQLLKQADKRQRADIGNRSIHRLV